MAIKISGTTVIDNSRNISNISDATISGNATFTGVMTIPVGNTSQRPASPATGQLRYNTESGQSELYNGTEYTDVGGATGTFPIVLFNGNTVNIPAQTGRTFRIFGRSLNTDIPLEFL